MLRSVATSSAEDLGALLVSRVWVVKLPLLRQCCASRPPTRVADYYGADAVFMLLIFMAHLIHRVYVVS